MHRRNPASGNEPSCPMISGADRHLPARIAKPAPASGPAPSPASFQRPARRARLVARIALFAGLGTALAGCATPTDELSKVARDWSRTIRASQVIPVYPLTQDIRPGDIFLVPVPIAKQAEQYDQKGFLPIDQMVERLSSLPANDGFIAEYRKFYNDSYWKTDFGNVPHTLPQNETAAVAAPRVAFPSYSFSISRSAGLNLALPIQGIPVGLGILNADDASATVTIEDAYTYGLSSSTIYRELLKWHSDNPQIADKLEQMTKAAKNTDGTPGEIYLRVVTRVYQTRKLSVSLLARNSTAAGIDAGLNSLLVPDNIATLSAEDIAKRQGAYDSIMKSLSDRLNTSATGIGASARLRQVTARSVTMVDTFTAPLTIGVIGFDVKILPNGQLSAPIPSFLVLENRLANTNFNPDALFANACGDVAGKDLYLNWLVSTPEQNRKTVEEFIKAEGLKIQSFDLACNAAAFEKFTAIHPESIQSQ